MRQSRTVPTEERRRRIFALALPILGGMLSQNLLNLVDTYMVGDLGDVALAAVNLGGFANFMCFAFVTGMSAGVQALCARRVGEGRTGETAVPLNGGLWLVLLVGLPLTVVLYALAGHIFGLLEDTPEVVAQGTAYLRARLVGLVAVGANFAFRGYFNATDQSRVYLRTLLVMHALNVFFNWLLIDGHLGFPAMGTLGSGVATTIATFLGTAIYVFQAWFIARGSGFLRGLPDRDTMRTMLRLSVPAGMQQMLFAAGMTAFGAIVSRVGTAEQAASAVLMNLILVAILPGLGFGLAATSLVGQALGRGDADDARRWGWDVTTLAMVGVTLISLPAMIFPDLCLRPFLHDPETRALAVTPLRLVALSLPLDTAGVVLLNALFGAGDMRRAIFISIGMQYLVQLPLIWLVAVPLHQGMMTIWGVQTAYRLTQAALLVAAWRGGRWAHARL